MKSVKPVRRKAAPPKRNRVNVFDYWHRREELRWVYEAAEYGLPLDHVLDLFWRTHEAEVERLERVREIRETAWRRLRVNRFHRAFTDGDYDGIKGFDVVADALQRDFPDLLPGDASESLYALLCLSEADCRVSRERCWQIALRAASHPRPANPELLAIPF